ncbi:MAG TPA: TolC family protein [Polyangiales bacterium]|nr:TolC family protein [Polyangiales bacterium]
MLRAVTLLSLAFASLARAQANPLADSPNAAITDLPVGDSYTLEDALRVMREQHPMLKSALYAINAAKADRVDARLWTNPVLGAQYYYGVRHQSYDRAGYVSYGVTQFLELANAPGARGRAAELGILAARSDYEAMLLQMSLDVQSALIALVAAHRKVELSKLAVELLDHVATVIGQRVSAGASPRYDNARIAVTQAQAHADLSSARADEARASGDLRAAIGPGVGTLRGQPTYSLEAEPRLPAPEQLVETLAARRPDFEAARQRAATAAANIEVSKRLVWPGVGLNVNGGFGAGPQQVDVGVGLTVALPVIDRGQGSVAAAQQRSAEATAYLDGVITPARELVYGVHAEVMARRHALERYLARAVASGDEMLVEAQAGYLAGRFSVLELADAYGAWRDARLRAVELAAATRQSEIDLARAVGVRLP